MQLPVLHIDKLYPSLTGRDRVPANCAYPIAYARAIHWQHPGFSLVQQYHDARHLYLYLVEIRNRIPLDIPISCPRPDLYWLYQLEGNSHLAAGGAPKGAMHLHAGEYRLAYTPTGEYTLSAKPGKHLLFFFVVRARWLLRYAQRDFRAVMPLLTALAQGQDGCAVSPTLHIHDKVRQLLLQLAGLSTPPGMALDARIYTPIIALAGISQADLNESEGKDGRSLQLAKAVREYIRAQVRQGTVPPVSGIVRHFNVSPQYLGRVHRQHYGQTVQQYIIRQKLEEARRLLREEGFSVSQTAYHLGYGELSSFSKQFKKYFGMSPSAVNH